MALDAKQVQAAFGRRLRELRQERGVSQEELAFRSGLHRTYVSSAERGQRNVSLINIYKLATALEVEAASMLAPFHLKPQ